MEQREKINRNDFLKKMGFTGAALFALYTNEACTIEEISAGGVTFDLTAAANAALKSNGGFVIKSGVVLANNNGTYVAASLNCTHEDLKQMVWKNGQWYCTAHGAKFDLAGKGLNKEGSKGLTIYQTAVSGNIVTVTV